MPMFGARLRACTRVTITFLLAACMIGWLAPHARAQHERDMEKELLASPQYRTAIQEAVASFDAARYAEAHEHFSRAHAIVPNARTLRGLGMVELELGRRVSAARHLEQALASTVLPLDGTMRALTQASLTAVRQQLAQLQVVVEPPEARASVRLAGNLVPQRESIVLEPGTYEAQVFAEGFAATRETVALAAGDDRLLTIRLNALPTPRKVLSAPHAASAAEPSRVPWYVVAGGAAVGETGAVLLGLAHRQQVRVSDAPPGSVWSDYEDDARSYRRYRAGGIALVSLGAAGVVSGLIGYTLSRREARVRVALDAREVRLVGRF